MFVGFGAKVTEKSIYEKDTSGQRLYLWLYEKLYLKV